MTRTFAFVGLLCASVLTASCESMHPTTSPQIAITIQVAAPPTQLNCGQNVLVFSGPYVDPCGNINLSSFSGPSVSISLSIKTPGYGFFVQGSKDSLFYSEAHGGHKVPVIRGPRFMNGIVHTPNGNIQVQYNNTNVCLNGGGTGCQTSDYGIYLSRDGQFFKEVDPILINKL